jgi:hypothetical protein
LKIVSYNAKNETKNLTNRYNIMKTYLAKYDPILNKGVYGISLVEKPAMEGTFIALSKEEKAIELKTVNEEQRILLGLVLEPNKLIYRYDKDTKEEYNITFDEQTIKELSYGFFKNNSHSNSTIEHNDKQITGVTFTESWIVENPTNDKSNNFGFSYPKGSWVAVMKVDSDEIWNDYVKTGSVKGFSIDAMLSLEEVNLKSQIEMSKENENSLIQFLKDLPHKIALAMKGEPEQEAVKLGSQKTKDGNVEIMFDGEMMMVGEKVYVIAEDGTEVPLPIGEYELEDGKILVVQEDGIVAELKDAMVAPDTSDSQEPASMASDSEATAKAIENAIKSIMIKYSSETAKEIADLKNEILTLSNQPASKPIKSVPSQAETKGKFSDILNKLNNN